MHVKDDGSSFGNAVRSE